VFVERREFAVGPVLVKNIEPQHVAFDDEVIESRHRIRVVARAAHHAAQLVADFIVICGAYSCIPTYDSHCDIEMRILDRGLLYFLLF